MTSPAEYFRRIKSQMVREPLPPEDIAAGWALGMFVGCAIPFGMQLLVSVPLALMMRVSKVGATVGTLITNPATIFVIYPIQTWVVNRILFGGSLTLSKLMETEWTWESVRRLGAEAMFSFFIGGFVLAIVLTPLTYFLVKRFVVAHRAHKTKITPLRDKGHF